MSWLILFVHLCRGYRNVRQIFANYHRYEDEFAVGDQVLLDASNLSLPGICRFR